MQFRLALLVERQPPSGLLLSEDDVASIFSDSTDKQMSASFPFRVSLHNKMYSGSIACFAFVVLCSCCALLCFALVFGFFL